MSTEILEAGEAGCMSITRFYGDCGNCRERGARYQISMPLDTNQSPSGYGFVQLCGVCLERACEEVRRDAGAPAEPKPDPRRDEFAARLAQGLVTAMAHDPGNLISGPQIANTAVDMADCLLEALARPKVPI